MQDKQNKGKLENSIETKTNDEEETICEIYSKLSYSQERKLKKSKFRDIYQKYTNTITYQTFMAFISLFFVFGPSVKSYAFTKEIDEDFLVVNVVFLAIFTLDFLANLSFIPNYYNSFFFWLDIFSISSFTLDLKWIDDIFLLYLPREVSIQKRRFVRSSGASRAGLRFTRLIRLILLIRFTKMFDSYTNWVKKRLNLRNSNSKTELSQINKSPYSKDLTPYEINLHCIDQTQMGTKLFGKLTQDYILLILFTVLSLFFVDPYIYYKPSRSVDFDIIQLSQLSENNFGPSVISDFCLKMVELNKRTETPLLYLQTPFNISACSINQSDIISSLRDFDLYTVVYYDKHFQQYKAIISVLEEVKLFAMLEIIRPSILTFILFSVSIILSINSNNLIIKPIYMILCQLRALSANPLNYSYKKLHHSIPVIHYIEKLIIRVSNLMFISFGRFGSRIIARNVEESNSNQIWFEKEEFPKSRVIAIFGISNCLETLEILKDDKTEFLNLFSEFVHSTCIPFLGLPSYGFNEKLVMFWKLPENGATKEKLISEEITTLAMISILKLISTFNESLLVKTFSSHSELKKRFGENPISLEVGIDIGEGYEGVYGTKLKINPLFYSPKLHYAVQIQKTCSYYGKPLIFTEAVYNFLNRELKPLVQNLEFRKIKKQKVASILHSINLFPKENHHYIFNMKLKESKGFDLTYSRETFIKLLGTGIDFDRIITFDNEIEQIKYPNHISYLNHYHQGMNFLSTNNSKEALQEFKLALSLLPNDKSTILQIKRLENRIFLISDLKDAFM